MKKVVLSLLAFVLVGVLAFGDEAATTSTFKVGTWSRIGIDVWGSDGTNAVLGTYPGWAKGSRFGFQADGTSANVFWHLDMNTDGGTNNVDYAGVFVDDQAKVGVKFNEFVTLQMGKIEGDFLRGKVSDGGDTNVAGYSADNLFQRFYPKKGFLLELTPVGNLYAAAALDVNGTNVDANNAWKSLQLGVGYTINNLGLLRAQYIGAPTSATWFNAAFNYTAVENLNIDTGVKISADSSSQDIVSLGGKYTSGPSSFQLTLQALVAGPEGSKADFGFWLEENFNIEGPLGVGIEASATSTLATSGRTVDAFPYLSFSYSNAFLQAGVHVVSGLDGQKTTYSIPIWVTSWF